MYAAGSISKAALEDVRVKARKARVSYGYDPATLEGDEEVGDEGVDRL